MTERIQRWTRLLDDVVGPTVAAATDPAATVARALYACAPTAAPVTDPRPEIARLYRYASALPRRDRTLAALHEWIGPDEPDPAVTLPVEAQPESWWYRQLVRLHGLTNRAILLGDPAGFHESRRLAEFVHAEIQPDHATALPWAIHALVLAGQECEPTAEWVLNACMIQTGGTPGGAALVLLADALYGLRHVVSRGTGLA